MSDFESRPLVFAERRLRHGHRTARLALLTVAGLAVALAAGFGWMATAWRAESIQATGSARLASLQRARALISAGGPHARDEALAALEKARLEEPADVGLIRSASALISVRESDFWPVARERRFGAVGASPDATAVLFSPEPGVMEVWHVGRRERLARVSHGSEEVHYPVLSQDARFLAARRNSGGLVVWNLKEDQEVISRGARRLGSSRQTIAFAPPEEERVFYADQGERLIHGLDLSNGRLTQTWEIEAAVGPVACHSQALLAVGGEDGVRLLQPDGRARLILPTPSSVTSLAWRSDGHLLVAGLADGRLAFHHLPRGSTWLQRGHDSLVSAVKFSRDGRLLATAGWDGRTMWYDGAGHGPFLSQRTGVLMALASEKALFYRGENGVGEWTVTPPAGYRRFELPEGVVGEISGLAIDHRAGLLAASNREAVRLWDLNSGDMVLEIPWPLARGLALQGHRFLAAGRDGVAIIEPVRGDDGNWRIEPIKTIEGTRDRSFSDVAVSGQKVAASGDFGLICCRGDEIKELSGMPSGEEARLALAANGSTLASSLWKGGGTVLKGEGLSRIDHAGGSVALSPDGNMALVGSNDGYAFWECTSGNWRETLRFPDDQGGDFPGKALFAHQSPRAAWLWRQSAVSLLDLSGRQPIEDERIFPGGDSSLFALALSADDRWLAAGTGDGQIHLWDLKIPIPRFSPGESTTDVLPNRFSMALIAALVVLLVAGTAAGWLVLRERRLLTAFIESQHELHAQRERLRLAERMETLGRLSAGVAHDFRNLLSVIRVRSGLLRRAVAGDRALAGDADAIEGAVCKAEGVVRALLQLGQSGSDLEGSFDAGAELVGLKDLFNARGRGVEEFEIRVEDPLPMASGREVEFQQLALNLGWNALDAVAASGGRVLLSLRGTPVTSNGQVILSSKERPVIWLTAEDSGVGLNQEDAGRVFEPFYSTKGLGPGRGTGLGLSTVHAICRTRGYQLEVGHSPELGGALFAIGFPAHPLPA